MKHFCIITSKTHGKPEIYRAICGHESTERREFVLPIENSDPSKITCDKCMEYRSRGVVIVAKESA